MNYELNDKREAHEMNGQYFVVMRDKFMSGWGNAPSSSVFVMVCPNLSTAESVAYHAENRRTEMKYVSIKYNSKSNLKEMLRSRRLGQGDHVSVHGLNPQWMGWNWSEANALQIRELWN